MSFPVEPSAPTLSLPPTRDSSERQPQVNRRSVPRDTPKPSAAPMVTWHHSASRCLMHTVRNSVDNSTSTHV